MCCSNKPRCNTCGRKKWHKKSCSSHPFFGGMMPNAPIIQTAQLPFQPEPVTRTRGGCCGGYKPRCSGCYKKAPDHKKGCQFMAQPMMQPTVQPMMQPTSMTVGNVRDDYTPASMVQDQSGEVMARVGHEQEATWGRVRQGESPPAYSESARTPLTPGTSDDGKDWRVHEEMI